MGWWKARRWETWWPPQNGECPRIGLNRHQGCIGKDQHCSRKCRSRCYGLCASNMFSIHLWRSTCRAQSRYSSGSSYAHTSRICGSGIQSIVTGAQMIMLDEASTVVAGGMENLHKLRTYYVEREMVGNLVVHHQLRTT